jgi:hypothetical protein
VTLGRLIRTTQSFIIPPFQRNYAWGEKQYSAFWQDLAQTFQDGSIFLGASVFKPTKLSSALRQLTVIDGQQRLTTAAILLSALRHHLRAKNLNDAADEIETRYLRGVDPFTGLACARFSLNAANKPTFDDHIYKISEMRAVHEQRKGKRAYNTNALLLGCFMFMHKRIALAQRLYGCDLEQLAAKITRSIEERATLIHISVSDDANAYLLFETLNERGLELSQFDILKNYILTLARPQSARAISAWVAVENNLRGDSVPAFIRQHWLSRGKTIEEKHLFSEVKREITGAREAHDYLASLERASAHYAALLDSGHAHWQGYSPGEQAAITASVRALRSLGATQPFVMLLAAMEISETDAATREAATGLFRLAVSFTVRYSTICGFAPSRSAISYVRAAGHIRRNRDLAAQVIFEKFFAALYPSDEVFATAFRNKRSQDSAICRYLLAEINGATSGAVTANAEAASLDHILPRNPSIAWRGARRHFRDGFDRSIYRLGNMTLLAAGENQKAGNAAFSAKRQSYVNDGLEITRRVALAEKWTAKEIDKRQKWMAEVAVNVWRCP